MSKNIHYIGSMSIFADKYNLMQFPAANTKINYILGRLRQEGYSVKYISFAATLERKFKLVPYIRKKHSYKQEDILLPSIGSKYKILRAINIPLLCISLILYIIFNVKKNDKVLVYHSMSYVTPLIIMKKIKRFELILELEEIYQDINRFSKRMRKNEYKIIRLADKYIFSTELLNQKLSVENKPFLIVNGTYKVEDFRGKKFKDGKIHVVYAGTFDPRKGGAQAAVEAAKYLPKNYHVHIIGFGSKDDTNMLLKKIDEISKMTEATVTYDGLLNGEDYINFLQKCDIGLSTQIPEASYNETSFPSKILSYMANGLRVVSIRTRAIEMSAVGHAVFYYEEQSPKAIANAITSIDMNKSYDSRKLVSKLDKDFVKNIKKLLEE